MNEVAAAYSDFWAAITEFCVSFDRDSLAEESAVGRAAATLARLGEGDYPKIVEMILQRLDGEPGSDTPVNERQESVAKFVAPIAFYVFELWRVESKANNLEVSKRLAWMAGLVGADSGSVLYKHAATVLMGESGKRYSGPWDDPQVANTVHDLTKFPAGDFSKLDKSQQAFRIESALFSLIEERLQPKSLYREFEPFWPESIRLDDDQIDLLDDDVFTLEFVLEEFLGADFDAKSTALREWVRPGGRLSKAYDAIAQHFGGKLPWPTMHATFNSLRKAALRDDVDEWKCIATELADTLLTCVEFLRLKIERPDRDPEQMSVAASIAAHCGDHDGEKRILGDLYEHRARQFDSSYEAYQDAGKLALGVERKHGMLPGSFVLLDIRQKITCLEVAVLPAGSTNHVPLPSKNARKKTRRGRPSKVLERGKMLEVFERGIKEGRWKSKSDFAQAMHADLTEDAVGKALRKASIEKIDGTYTKELKKNESQETQA